MYQFDSQALHDTFYALLFYHKVFAALFALPFILNLLVLFFSSHKLVSMNKKIWFITPITFFLLSVNVLSGVNLWIFGTLPLSLPLIMMVTFCIFILIGEIYRLKILKIARRTNLKAMQGYIKFSKILYGIDLLFFILIFAYTEM